jgi:hypothetical protein
MRHGSIDLTMNTYTDPKLLDVARAMDSLPTLPLVGREASEAVAVKATGTDDSAGCQFAPTIGKTRTLQSILDKIASADGKSNDAEAVAATACPVKQKRPLTTGVNGRRKERETGIEPATTSLGS